MIIPNFLLPNDKVAIISPSGCIAPSLIDGAANFLSTNGLSPIIGTNAKHQSGRYCGTIEERLSDIKQAFENPEIRAILCSRGGYGIVQLLEQLPDSLFQENPKWLIGYSDITALHAALQKASIASLHAPMAKHLAEEPSDNTSSLSLLQFLKGTLPSYTTPYHYLNRCGTTRGVVRGGNLSVLSGLRGTPYDLPKNEEFILFIEEIGERPYHVERMLINFRMGGVVERVKGLIVGQFTNYEEDLTMEKLLFETISDVVSNYNFPICFDFPVGHTTNNLPLPCGMQAELTVRNDGSSVNYNVKL